MATFDMRTRNEKILLALLIAILFAGGNYYGYQWLSQKQSSMESTYKQLHVEQSEAKVELLETDKWAQRMAWIRDHEPALGEEGATKADVLNYVKQKAVDHNLAILDQALVDRVAHGPAGAKVGVTFKVKGSMENLVKWVADLQKPGSFYAISSFSINADQDQKSMVCSLQLVRYFKEGS